MTFRFAKHMMMLALVLAMAGGCAMPNRIREDFKFQFSHEWDAPDLHVLDVIKYQTPTNRTRWRVLGTWLNRGVGDWKVSWADYQQIRRGQYIAVEYPNQDELRFATPAEVEKWAAAERRRLTSPPPSQATAP